MQAQTARNIAKVNKFLKKHPLTDAQRKETKKLIDRRIKVTAEPKYHLENFQLFSGDTGSVVRLAGIAQGIGDTGRVGNDIRMLENEFRYSITQADGTNIIRVIFFLWHNNSIPVTSNIIHSTAQNTSPWLAQVRMDNKQEFTILSDRTFSCVKGGPSEVITQKYTKRYPGLGKLVNYQGNTANVLAPRNNLFLCVISDSGAISHPDFTLAARVVYTDV